MPYPKDKSRNEIFESVKSRFPQADKAAIDSFIDLAETKDLNPLDNQLQMITRWDKDNKVYRWIPIIGIDGFRLIAKRAKADERGNGAYLGGTAPEFAREVDGEIVWSEAWVNSWGYPIAARIGVYISGSSEPTYGVAHFEEYAGKSSKGGLTFIWATKYLLMLAKCAEVLALRRGFPDELSGLYSSEEFSGINGEGFTNASNGQPIVNDSSGSPAPEKAVTVRESNNPAKPHKPETKVGELRLICRANKAVLGEDFINEIEARMKDAGPEQKESIAAEFVDKANQIINRNGVHAG